MQQVPTITQSPEEPTTGSGESKHSLFGKTGWRSVLSTVGLLIAAPLLALALTAYVFQSYEVDGPSMESTLQNQDRLIVLKVPRTLARITHHAYIPKRGTIVIFKIKGLSDFGDPEDEKQLVKRVVGLPGEHVVVKDGKITIYNKEHPNGFDPDIDGGYGNLSRLTPGDRDEIVPEGSIFVCGDNRTNSRDSRSFGPVPANQLVGELVFRLLPLSKAKAF